MEPKGRGGWLGFLIFQLFATPLIYAGRDSSDLFALEAQGVALPGGFYGFYLFSIILCGSLLFYSGHLLATGAKRQDALDAIKYMWFGLAALNFIPMIVMEYFFPQLAKIVAGEFVKQVFTSIIWGTVWTIYIFKSKRIKNTFMPSGGWPTTPSNNTQPTPIELPSLTDRQQENPPLKNSSPPQQSTPPHITDLHEFDRSKKISIEEIFWEKALVEFEKNRRPGLWAKSFSKAKGNEDIAKAIYLEERVNELSASYELLLLKKEEIKKAEDLLTAKKEEEQRQIAYEMAPKGECSNCQTIQILSSDSCKHCKAIFGQGSKFLLKPTSI